jgi:carbon storage regulator
VPALQKVIGAGWAIRNWPGGDYHGAVEATQRALEPGGNGMLVLQRKLNEAIDITIGGERIVLTVVDIRSDRVRIGIDAPKHATVHRREVTIRINNGEPKGA